MILSSDTRTVLAGLRCLFFRDQPRLRAPPLRLQLLLVPLSRDLQLPPHPRAHLRLRLPQRAQMALLCPHEQLLLVRRVLCRQSLGLLMIMIMRQRHMSCHRHQWQPHRVVWPRQIFRLAGLLLHTFLRFLRFLLLLLG